MSNYTMKTASLKSTILLSNIVLVGDTTLINKRGINTNNIVADSIKTRDEDVYLTKSAADSLYGGSSLLYDWTPALELKIQFSLLEGESYTAPSNGWFVVNEKEINEGSVWFISINQRPMFHSNNNGLLYVLVLVKMGDVITFNSNTSRNGYFMPCVSELRDWRVEELKSDADIWKNAVVHNADGTTTVRDQWLVNASYVTDNWGRVYGGSGLAPGSTGSDREFQRTIHTIKEDEAFDLEGNHLFYVQTENILQGVSLFDNTSLTVFNGDLSSLTNGYSMFYYSDIESFNGDLSSLTNGNYMFFSAALKSFSGNLSNLTNGELMFYGTGLKSFSSDLSSLTNGSWMFNYCTSLESFNSDLSSLTGGEGMFCNCKLNLESVQNIANTIKTVSSGSITIGIQSSLQGNTELTTALTTIGDKGWTVTTQYN